MFKQLTDNLSNSLGKLRSLNRLTEANMQDSLQSIRRALLDADVALPVVDDFLAHIKQHAVGQKIMGRVKPGQALTKIVQDEITRLLGNEQQALNLKAQPPIVILLVGLQGTGKTTTAAKLAHWLKQEKKSVMLASTDVYRPAAIEQLQQLATQVGATFFSHDTQNPVKIAKKAVATAKKQFSDVLIIDTAGRLSIDESLMQELQDISKQTTPQETLLVVDSMTGQDAIHIANNFQHSIQLSGLILSKADGDARGGAALSMRQLTHQPIKFIGIGEKIDQLEAFHPERIASRILGMGDIVSLVEQAKRKTDQKQAGKLAKKLQKGKRFDFNDFLNQLGQLKKLGGMQSLLSKMPMLGQAQLPTKQLLDDQQIKYMTAIIQSMTAHERQFPALIKGSRKARIANGSGTSPQQVNQLLKQFDKMQKMTQKLKGNKMAKRLKQMQGNIPEDIRSQLPPDLLKDLE